MPPLLSPRSPRAPLTLVALLLLSLLLVGPTCAGPQVTDEAGTPTPEPTAAEAVSPTPTPSPDATPPLDLSTWNELIVKPAEGVTDAQLQAALQQVSGSEVSLRPSLLGRYLATFAATDPPRDQAAQEALAVTVAALPEVAEAQANARINPAGR